METFIEHALLLPWKNKHVKKKIREGKKKILQRPVCKDFKKILEPIFGKIEKISFEFQRFEFREYEEIEFIDYLNVQIIVSNSNIIIEMIGYRSQVFCMIDNESFHSDEEIYKFLRYYKSTIKTEDNKIIFRTDDFSKTWNNNNDDEQKYYEEWVKLKTCDLIGTYIRKKQMYQQYPIHYYERISLLILMTNRFDKNSILYRLHLDIVRLLTKHLWEKRFNKK